MNNRTGIDLTECRSGRSRGGGAQHTFHGNTALRGCWVSRSGHGLSCITIAIAYDVNESPIKDRIPREIRSHLVGFPSSSRAPRMIFINGPHTDVLRLPAFLSFLALKSMIRFDAKRIAERIGGSVDIAPSSSCDSDTRMQTHELAGRQRSASRSFLELRDLSFPSPPHTYAYDLFRVFLSGR